MVSDFVDVRNGYLALTDEEYLKASKDDPAITKEAHQLLAYGENREGYWTCEKFMHQLEAAVKICESLLVGNGFGCLTSLVAIQQWQRTHLMYQR